MRENHPYFDRPLFFIGRDSRLRKFCQRIVARRYQPHDEWGRVGKKPHGYLKKLHALFGLITVSMFK
jgi:hypothetical protein